MSAVAEALRGLKLGAREIAEKSQLPLARVDSILAGESATLVELRAISAGLRLPLHILAKGRSATDERSALSPLFRNIGKSASDYDVTVEKVATFVEAALAVLPVRVSLPDWLQELQVKNVSYPEADRLARRFRDQFYCDRVDEPATDLPEILGRADGVILTRLLFSRYEGVSLIAGNYCFIFVSPRFEGRMLFTLGHELGHIIAHHKQGRPALFERPSEIGSFGRNARRESFVDAFASCLLLPDEGIGKALRSFRGHYGIDSPHLTDFEIILLARFYGVSFEVAARRCEDLEILPKGMGFALATRIKKQFGSPEKRANELGAPKRTHVQIPAVSEALGQAILRAINDRKISLGWATDRFGLSIGEVLSANTNLEKP